MTGQLRRLHRILSEMGQAFREELERMPRYGKPCNCDEYEEIELLEFPSDVDREIRSYCLNCGGHVVRLGIPQH